MGYEALHLPNQIVIGQGGPVIVTGWSLVSEVVKRLDESEYGAIGALYSRGQGVSILIKNLLFNPEVNQVLILGGTKQDERSGSVDALCCYLGGNEIREGVDDLGSPSWVIEEKFNGRRVYIDRSIALEDLEALRRSVMWARFSSIKDLVSYIRGGWAVEVEATRERRVYRDGGKASVKQKPGRRVGHLVAARSIGEGWLEIINRIRSSGRVVTNAYGSQNQELLNITTVISDEFEDISQLVLPDYLPISNEFVSSYVGEVLLDNPSKGVEGVKYTYGERLRSWFGVDQVERAAVTLSKNYYSTRVVLSLWDVSVDGGAEYPPCLDYVWVRITERNELTLTAVFRSHDCFSAWAANAVALRALQIEIRNRVMNLEQCELGLGELTIISNSAHIYDSCWEYADRVIKENYKLQRRYDDPVGNFVIRVEGDEVIVEWTSPATQSGGGNIVERYVGNKGSDRSKLLREIVSDCGGIEAAHAMYLGMELERAFIAREMGLRYEQDKKLEGGI